MLPGILKPAMVVVRKRLTMATIISDGEF